jgi:hypothetical protein
MKNNFLSPSDPESLFTDPLDGLLADALKQQSSRQTRVKATPSKDDKPLVKPAKLTPGFYSPENWERSRTISLIHQPTNTLLGNFHELHYKPWPATRKLVRVEGPVPTEGTEFVTGDWWLQQEVERHQDPQRWVETRAAILGITLAECGLHCDAAEVRVRLEHGYVARVELAQDTRFTCPERNTFLILHAGLDVQGCMSLDSRLALKAELAIGEEEA